MTARARKGLERGFVQVFTGDGKGKTTAAIGLAVRAAGAGLRVYIAHFAKPRLSGEDAVLRALGDQVVVRRCGAKGFIRGQPCAADREAARRGLRDARAAMLALRFDVVVLDEICVAVHLGLLPVESVLELIRSKPERVELILTGRRAHRRILASADLVTEMREVKHYFRRGIAARRGIEY